MEQSLTSLGRRWNLLRIISTGIFAAASLLVLLSLPNGLLTPAVPFSLVGVAAASLAVTKWKILWAWLAVVTESLLFTIGLFAVVFGMSGSQSIPGLLLAFTLTLAGEHTLTTNFAYSAQFSNQENPVVREFNAEALTVSLAHLYARIARDSLILGTGFVLSLAAASLSTVGLGPASAILSDPSLYIIIASISLAALVTLKEE